MGAGSDAFVGAQFGRTTKVMSANEVIWNFFAEHPMKMICHTSQPGEVCFDAVERAMQEGLATHPEWRDSITNESTFEEYQSLLHSGILADCPKPCKKDLRASHLTGSTSFLLTTTTSTSAHTFPNSASPPNYRIAGSAID